MQISAGQTNFSSEEELADFIQTLFDWLEQQDIALFKYGDINLRTALERSIYFDAINRPEALRHLLVATRKFKKSLTASDVDKQTYKNWELKIGKSNFFSLRNFFVHIYVILRIFVFNFKAIFSNIKKSLDNFPSSIAFFALNNRFVFFYKEVIKNLEHNNCIFLEGVEENISNAVNQVGASLVKSRPVPVDLTKINISPFNPLFNHYSQALIFYLSIYGTLQNLKPSVLVFAEGTSMQDQVACFAAKSLLIPTVRMQSGRVGVLDSGYRGMQFSKILCWGDGFVERLKKVSPVPAYYVTGNPFIDRENQGSLASKHKKTIVFISQPVSTNISAGEYSTLVDLAKKILIEKPELNLIFRKHPLDKSNLFNRLEEDYPSRTKLMDFDKYSLRSVLSESFVAIGFFSTALSEAAAYGVMPIIYKINDNHLIFPNPEKYGAAIVANNVNEILMYLGMLMHDEKFIEESLQNMKDFADRFFGPRDGLAMQRILDHLKMPS